MAKSSIKPNPDEVRNGWDARSLQKYHEEREAQLAEFTADQKLERPVKVETVDTFNPHDWLT